MTPEAFEIVFIYLFENSSNGVASFITIDEQLQ